MKTLEQIIQGCQKNQKKAQEALYKMYAPQLFSLCVRFTKTQEDAEDVFHEAFMKVFDKIIDYQGTGSFEGWLKRVFINASINSYHRYKRDKERFFSYDDTEAEKWVENDVDIIENLSVDELYSLVNLLPQGYKLVFNLYVVEGYAHKEIAEMLEISEGTSKSQLFKAKNMLKKMVLDNQKEYYAKV